MYKDPIIVCMMVKSQLHAKPSTNSSQVCSKSDDVEICLINNRKVLIGYGIRARKRRCSNHLMLKSDE